MTKPDITIILLVQLVWAQKVLKMVVIKNNLSNKIAH